jgi:hypothetical protein
MLITALAAALLVQQAAGLEAPVTLEFNTSTVPVVMQEMEKQTGVKIHVKGAPLQDFIYARFTNRPLKSALDVLAKLCESKWEMSEGEVYFSAPWPPSGTEDLDEQIRIINDWLSKNPIPPPINKATADKIIDESVQLQGSNLPDSYQASDKLYKQTPLPRAHLRLLHAIGAKNLATIPKGESRVYMLQGKGRVAALPASAASIFKDFIAERSFYRDQLANRGLGSESYEGGTYIPAIQNYSQNSLEETDWIVVVQNEQYGYQAELRGFTIQEGGYNGMSTNDTLMVAPSYGSFETKVDNDDFAKFTEPYTPPASWQDNVKMPTAGEGTPKLSPILTQRLIHMDVDEVLTDFVYDPLHALSESRKADVVAILPDAGFFGVIYGSLQSTNLGGVLRMAMMNQARITEMDGAYLVAPALLLGARQARIARVETAKYIQAGIANGRQDIDTTADLVVAINDETALMFAIGVASLVLGDENNSFLGNIDVLRLYGHLNDTQRKQAKGQGLSLPYTSLTKAQQAVIEKMMNGRNAGIADKDQPNEIENSTAGGWEMDDLIQLKLPNGIPRDAQVTFRTEKRNKLFGQMEMEGGFKYTNEVNVDSMAWSKAYEEAGYEGFFGGNMKSFTYADRTYMQVTVDMGDLGYFSQSLPIGGPDKNSKYISLSELPQEVQDDYNKKLKEYREQVKQMGPPTGGGNGVRRPPPP